MLCELGSVLESCMTKVAQDRFSLCHPEDSTATERSSDKTKKFNKLLLLTERYNT